MLVQRDSSVASTIDHAGETSIETAKIRDVLDTLDAYIDS